MKFLADQALQRRLLQSAVPVFMLVIVAVVFWPGLTGDFIFDDFPAIVHNDLFKVVDWNSAAWEEIWRWSMRYLQRPFAMATFALNFAFGSGTWGFKATNLALHLINTVLVMLLALRLLGSGLSPNTTHADATFDSRTRLWAISLATAWAIHPLQVSTVLYVVQRMEILGFTFTLLALLAYLRARRRQQAGQRGWPWLLASLGATIVGLGAKETVVLVAGYALLLELTILRFETDSVAKTLAWKIFYASGSVLAALVLALYVVPHYGTPEYFSYRDFTPMQRELTQLRVLPMYLGWCILPLPRAMHFYYDNYPISTGWLSPTTTLAGGLFLLALVAVAWSVRRKRPLLALGIGWFLMAHALTSAPFSLELVFEHRNYPALFGVLLAITDLIWLATRHAHPRLPAIVATIFLVAMGFFTLLRASTWGNPLLLATTLAQDNPMSPRASLGLARYYMAMANDNPESSMFARGIRELERGAALPKSSPLAEQGLLMTAAAAGLPQRPEWWNSLIHKLQERPVGSQELQTLQELGGAAINDGLALDPQRLSEAYLTVLQRSPDNATLHVQYADVATTVLRDRGLAIKHLETAVELKVGDSSYIKRLATHLTELHRPHEVLAVIAKAEALRPSLQHDLTLVALRTKADQDIQGSAEAN